MFSSPENSLRALIRFSPLAIVELDADAKVMQWNPAAEQMFGWAAGEVVGREYPVVPPEARGEFETDLLHVLGGATIQGKEVHRQNKDRRQQDARLWAAPIRNQQNEITGITAILEDITDQKGNESKLRVFQAREAEWKGKLQQSEERMRLAFKAANIGFWDWNLETGRVFLSANAATQMGLPDNSPQSFEALMSAVHPDHQEAVQTSIQDAIRENTEYEVEFRVSWPDGSLHWMCAKGRASYDTQGRPVRMVGITIDIDDRKAADEWLLLESAALQAAANSIVITDREGTILWTNQAFSESTGYSSEEVLGKSTRLLKSGVQDESVYTNMWATISSGKTWRGEITNRRKNGSLYAEEMTITPVRLGSRGVTHYVAIKQEITSRKAAEGLLLQKAALQEQLSTIITTVPGVVYSFLMRPDGSSSMPFASSRLLDIFDVSPGSVENDASPALSKIHADDLSRFQATTEESYQRLTPWHEEFRINHSTRGVVWAEGRSLPERQPDGSVLWHGFLIDITERKQLESRLLQAQKMEAIGNLAGGVAHDFNNIMGIVIGYSDLIAEKLPASDPNLSRIRKVKDAANRAVGLTRQLLAFSHQQVSAPKLLNLNTHITQLSTMLPTLLGENIQIVFSLDQNLGSVKADPTQIDQILMNLAVNARDAMPLGGKLVIESRNVELDASYATHPELRPGPFVMISVRDSGVGMSSIVKQHIFEPFFTTKERGRGTGLGLYTAYGIVKQSGGSILVDSEVEGGTTFIIYLPRVAGLPQATLPESSLGSKTTTSKTVLLAEDEPALREITGIQLQELGYVVLTASNGLEALRVAEEYGGPIDVLLTDLVMPNMNGRQLGDLLHQKFPQLKILFVSGYADDVVFRKGHLDFGTAFIQKPFSQMILGQRLRGLLEA